MPLSTWGRVLVENQPDCWECQNYVLYGLDYCCLLHVVHSELLGTHGTVLLLLSSDTAHLAEVQVRALYRVNLTHLSSGFPTANIFLTWVLQ